MVSSLLKKDRGGFSVLGTVWIFVLLMIAGNAFFKDGSALYVGSNTITLFGKYLCYALLAVSLDLIWGYLGILSLGHAAFFGLGGYVMGMYLMRQIGARGVYGNPELPDFMVFLNWHELPWYWYGVNHFWFAAILILLVPGALAFIFGFFAFRSRVGGVYLSIITQSLTFALALAFFRNETGFGGNNGLTDFKDILGFSLASDATRDVLLFLSALALTFGYLLCRYLMRSRLGKVTIAIRDAESRTRFMGYRVEYFKLAIFTVAAMLAGVAGALYVPQVGIINLASSTPSTRLRLSSGLRSAAARRSTARLSARSSSTTRRPYSPASSLTAGSMRWDSSSSSLPCSFRRALSASSA